MRIDLDWDWVARAASLMGCGDDALMAYIAAAELGLMSPGSVAVLVLFPDGLLRVLSARCRLRRRFGDFRVSFSYRGRRYSALVSVLSEPVCLVDGDLSFVVLHRLCREGSENES